MQARLKRLIMTTSATFQSSVIGGAECERRVSERFLPQLELASLRRSRRLVSILTGLVRRVGRTAKGTVTDTNRFQERTMRFMVMGMATKESEAGVPPTAEELAAMSVHSHGR